MVCEYPHTVFLWCNLQITLSVGSNELCYTLIIKDSIAAPIVPRAIQDPHFLHVNLTHGQSQTVWHAFEW